MVAGEAKALKSGTGGSVCVSVYTHEFMSVYLEGGLMGRDETGFYRVLRTIQRTHLD